MEVISLDLSLIDSEDTTFLVGHKENLSFLQSSIKEIGLLNPPILRVLGEKYQIISGWKRILSCKELGLTELLCKIYYSSDLSDIDCLKIVFYDNKDNFSDLELAELIKLFKDLCLIDDKALMDNILPLLEIPSTRKHLDKYLCLASLDQAIKDAYYRDKITIEQCQMLSEIVSDNQVPMLEYLLLKYNLNNNESRQVMQIVEEIALRDLKSIPEVVSQAEDAINTENKGKNELRQELRRMRYPELSSVEAEFKKAVQDLKLPNQINLLINQFFEGNDLEFRIKVKSTDELSQALHSLEGSLGSGDIEKLLNILRKGIN